MTVRAPMACEVWLLLALLASLGVLVAGDGLGGTNETAICVQTEREIRALTINTDQAKNGVEGGVITANACKQLVSANVMMYRTEEDQKALCDNECYPTINAKYKILLDNNCFGSTDNDETATGNLQAAAYQIACQTTVSGKYCIPMLATLVANAGTGYDLCSDIVNDMGCCFQSYKQYMQFGTSASIKTIDTIQQKCTKDGAKDIDKVCPCGTDNMYNKHALAGTTICSPAARLSSLLTSTMILFTAITLWFIT